SLSSQIKYSPGNPGRFKHQIMAGVVFSLRRALEQAEVFPSDPEWKWPFSICPNSESTFQKIGQKVALEEHQPTVS
ncbi:hypothetical protein D8Y98_23050, partial [Escherichia coli]|nr:hypothetical protein [Escherichia coli]